MDHAYRVEINRILQQVEKGTKAEDIARNSYPHIEKLQWLSAEEGSRETASAFFQEGNNLDMHVVPVYRKQKLTGYLRFDYHRYQRTDAAHTAVSRRFVRNAAGCSSLSEKAPVKAL